MMKQFPGQHCLIIMKKVQHIITTTKTRLKAKQLKITIAVQTMQRNFPAQISFLLKPYIPALKRRLHW